jgi:hypothetical protein
MVSGLSQERLQGLDDPEIGSLHYSWLFLSWLGAVLMVLSLAFVPVSVALPLSGLGLPVWTVRAGVADVIPDRLCLHGAFCRCVVFVLFIATAHFNHLLCISMCS